MVCRLCQLDPKAHSFINFAEKSINNHRISYYYTNPSKSSELIDSKEKFTYFKQHLDKAKERGSWIWIFDCAGMRSEHYCSLEFMRNLMKEVSEEHMTSLKAIWVIHPNTWMRSTIQLVKPFFKTEIMNKVNVLEETKLSLLDTLQKMEVPSSAIEWIEKTVINNKKNVF
jgi:hypothetical protein